MTQIEQIYTDFILGSQSFPKYCFTPAGQKDNGPQTTDYRLETSDYSLQPTDR